MPNLIDITTEEAISLNEVPKRLPKKRGKRIHINTIRRWANKGLRGRVLETILIGRERYTTVEALRRFLDTTTENAKQKSIDDAIERVLQRS